MISEVLDGAPWRRRWQPALRGDHGWPAQGRPWRSA